MRLINPLALIFTLVPFCTHGEMNIPLRCMPFYDSPILSVTTSGDATYSPGKSICIPENTILSIEEVDFFGNSISLPRYTKPGTDTIQVCQGFIERYELTKTADRTVIIKPAIWVQCGGFDTVVKDGEIVDFTDPEVESVTKIRNDHGLVEHRVNYAPK